MTKEEARSDILKCQCGRRLWSRKENDRKTCATCNYQEEKRRAANAGEGE